MCGIFSITASQKSEEKYATDAMLDTLTRRGPDDRRVLSLPGCTLGHTRLSILDLAGGHQPMRDNVHQDVVVSFNGEIYNFKELRGKLEAAGHSFSTNSDTEVILKSYLEYGIDCPKHLDGMFAFIVWDGRTETLFAARDRFGKKPLYYAFDDQNNLLIASEIKTLFASGHLKGVLDPAAIDNYLHLYYVPPSKTIYQNIFVLPPAHSAIYQDGKLSFTQYWQMPIESLNITENEAIDRLKFLLGEAVRKRLVADVEVGAFLSGGVDSSIVTYLAQQCADRPLKTFSAGFGDHINELPYAREAAKIAGTDHHELEIHADLPRVLEEVCAYYDEPFADSSSVPQYLISKFARTKVKVALSGDGGDEAFLGYGWYWKWRNLGWRDRAAAPFSSHNAYRYHLKNIRNFHPLERLALWKNPLHANAPLGAPHYDPRLSPSGNINMFDFAVWLPGDILTKVDRSSMMTSLEVRSPFLDTALVEFAFNLPEQLKTDHRSGKHILKKAFRGVFSDEFLSRRKQGFSAPAAAWLKRKEFREFAYVHLTGNEVKLYALFRKSFIIFLLRSFYENGVERAGYRIWILLCLELWLRSHTQHHA